MPRPQSVEKVGLTFVRGVSSDVYAAGTASSAEDRIKQIWSFPGT